MKVKFPNKGPSSEMLINHAMGNSNEAESLIITAHLAYCKASKDDVKQYEKLAGKYLFNEEVTKISNSLFNKVLKSIEAEDQEVKNLNYVDFKLNTGLSEKSIRVPSFVSRYLDSKFDTSDWSSTINNVKYSNLSFKDKSYSGKFLEIPPGKSMPMHGHEGYEATLVLHGGYSDEAGHYHTGDLVIANDSHVHTPVASKETGCLCLVIYSGSLKFKGLLGSILNLSKF